MYEDLLNEDNMNTYEESHFISMDPPSHLVKFHMDGEAPVTIKLDETVIIHEYGADKEAAKLFWCGLHVHGKNLLQRISELESENERLKNQLKSFEACKDMNKY